MVYMSSSFWLLAVGSCDLSQDQKNCFLRAEQIHKMTTCKVWPFLCGCVWWVMLSGYSLPERYNVVRLIFDFIRHIRVPSNFGHPFRNWIIVGSNRNREPRWRYLEPVSKLYTAQSFPGETLENQDCLAS